jgi:purine-binding chemotaxis protein CheW
MEDTLINSSTTNLIRSSATTASTLKVIAFKVNTLHLAVQIDAVHKILRHTSIYSSGLHPVGVAHVDDREVTVLDIQRRLFHTTSINALGESNYLIVIRNTLNELYGIPVETVPTLVDIPLSSLRVLPASYRQADTLSIASHVAIIPQDEHTLTLFLLSLDEIVTSDLNLSE